MFSCPHKKFKSTPITDSSVKSSSIQMRMPFCFGQRMELGMTGEIFAEYVFLDDFQATYPGYILGCIRGILVVSHSVYLKQIFQESKTQCNCTILAQISTQYRGYKSSESAAKYSKCRLYDAKSVNNRILAIGGEGAAIQLAKIVPDMQFDNTRVSSLGRFKIVQDCIPSKLLILTKTFFIRLSVNF